MLLEDRITQDIQQKNEQRAELSKDLGLSVEVSPDQYDFITSQMAKADDPRKMEIDIASAITYSRNLDLPLDYCMQNLPSLTKAYTGLEYTPTQTSFKAIANSFKLGTLTNTRAELGNQFRDLYMSGGDYSQVQAQIEQLDAEIESLQDYVPRPWYVEMLKFSANTLPYTGQIIMKGIEGGALGALGLKAAAAIGGVSLAAAPLAAAGAVSAATVAAAITAVSRYFQMKETRDLTKGNQFYDMVKAGIDPNVADAMSEISGWLSGAIEGGLGGITSSALEAAGMSPARFTSRVTTRLFLNGRIGQIANGAMRYLGSAAGEGLEEFTESIKDYIVDSIAYELSDLDMPVQDKGVLETAVEDFVGGFASSLVLGVIPAYMNTKRDARYIQTLKADAALTDSFEAFKDRYKNEIPEGITEADWTEGLKTIWDTQTDARSSLKEAYTQWLNTRAADISENIEYDEEGNIIPPETEARSGNVQRLPNGQLYTQESRTVERLPGGIEKHTLKIGSPMTGESYGYISYRITPDNRLEIENVRTYEGYEGIAKEGLQNLIRRYPDMDISFDSDIESLRTIRDELIAENPRGSEYGLNYGEQFSVDDRAEIMNRIGNLFSTETSVNSALATLVQLAGEAQGMTGTQWLDRNIKSFERFEEEGKKGGTAFVQTAEGMKAVIYAGRNADATTFEHELVHVIMAQNDHKQQFVDIFNSVKDTKQFRDFIDSTDIVRTKSDQLADLFRNAGQWSTIDEEFVAELYEAWRTTGQTSNTKLNQFFRRISEWFRRIYQTIRPSGVLNKEVSDFFDSFYGTGQGSASITETVINEAPQDGILYQLTPDYQPTNTVKSYKLMRIDDEGYLHFPLADTAVRVPLNVWMTAEDKSSINRKGERKTLLTTRGGSKMEAAPRPGFHTGEIPYANQLGVGGNQIQRAYTGYNDVWVEVEIAADVDWQTEANRRGTNAKGKIVAQKADIRDEIPFGGYYKYKTNPTARYSWLVSGNMKMLRILSDEEVNRILDDAETDVGPRMPRERGMIFSQEEADRLNSLNQYNENVLYQSQYTAEEQAVIDQYRDTDQWLKAPNGEDTKLTERQWVQVRTPSFKAWFGDWENDPANASKVVDENGEPKVVYHGSPKVFDTFSTDFLGNRGQAKGIGFYFAEDTDTANIYFEEGGQLLATFLNIRNPLDLEQDNFSLSQIKKILKKIVELEIKRSDGELVDYKDGFLSNFTDTYSTSLTASINEASQMLYEGNDSATDTMAELVNILGGNHQIVLDATQSILPYDGIFANIEKYYITWNPNQIKSATENVGTFDPNNPSILYQGNYGNGGYDWQRGMSNRAVRAYEMGEMPKSKWTKEAMKNALYDMIDSEIADVLLKLPIVDLKNILLEETSWHHTGKFFNETYFYSIRADVEDMTKEQAEKLLSDYKQYKKSLKEYRDAKTKNENLISDALKNNTELEIRYKGSVIEQTFTEKVKFLEKVLPYSGNTVMFEAKEETRVFKQEKEKFMSKLPLEISRFLNTNYAPENVSRSGNIYEQGRKPSRSNYIDPDYFKTGERRLSIDYNRIVLEEYQDGAWKPVQSADITGYGINDIYRFTANENIMEKATRAQSTMFTEEQLERPFIPDMPWEGNILYQSEDGTTTIQDIKGSLVLTHTLDKDILPEIEKLQGIPMPSLGITKPDLQNNLNIFGDITLVGSETLARKMLTNQWVYDRDLSSPMIPSEKYKIDTDNIVNFINDLRETIGPEFNNSDIDFQFIIAMEAGYLSPSDLAKRILSKWMGLYKTYADRLAISLDVPMEENNQVDLMAFAKYMLDNDSKRKQIIYALRKDIEKFFGSYFIDEKYKAIPFTAENILDYMKNKPLSLYEYNVISSIDELKTQAEQLGYDDVPYFEAKPQEVMQLSDFTAALVPSDLPSYERNILSEAGLQLVEYDPEARAQTLKAYAEKTPGILFQSSYDQWLDDATGYVKFASDFDDFLAFMNVMASDEGRPENAEQLLKNMWLEESYRRMEEETVSPEKYTEDFAETEMPEDVIDITFDAEPEADTTSEPTSSDMETEVRNVEAEAETIYETARPDTPTLQKPDEASYVTDGEKDAHFLDLLKDDKQADEFLERLKSVVMMNRQMSAESGGFADTAEELAEMQRIMDVAAMIETGIAPYIRNLFYSMKRRNTQTYNKIRGYVAANVRAYRNLYALAAEIDYWKGNYDYDAEIQEALPEDFETLSFSERSRAVQGIKNDIVRKAIFSGKEPYQDGAVEALIRELDDKIADAKEKASEDEATIKKLTKDVIALSVETGEQWKKIQALIDERVKLEKDLQKISEQIANRAKKNLGIEQNVISKQQTMLQRIQQIRQQEEQYVRGLKNKQAAETLDKRITQERLKAAKKYEQLKKRYDSKIDNLKALYKERAEARKAKAYKERVARMIMRKPSANVNWEEAEAIMEIQALVDPTFRQRFMIDGKAWSIESLKDLYKKNPDNVVFSSMSPEKLAILEKKNLNEYTIEELEDLAAAVSYLRQEGLRKRQAYVDSQRSKAAQYQKILIQQIRDSGKLVDDPIPGTKQARTNEKSFVGKIAYLYNATINMARKAQILDNGVKGTMYDLLVTQRRQHNAEELAAMKKRSMNVEKAIKDNGVSYSDLYRNFHFTIDGKDTDMTFSQLAYIYLSQFNERNRAAVAYGTLVTNREKRDINDQVKAQITDSGYKADNERTALRNQMVMEIGDRRYDEALRFAEKVMADNTALFNVVQAIQKDFNDGSHFAAIREVMLRVYNQEVVHEKNYLPIYRAEIMGEPAQKVREDIMNQIPGTRGSVEKGFTEARIDISPYNQLKVDYDLFKVWQDSVFMQEHTLANLEYVRLLNSVFINRGSQAVRDYITQTYGSSMMKAVDTHIKEIANPRSFENDTAVNRVIRTLKGSLYSAYLGYKTSGIVLQAITSPAPFIAKVGPLRLMKSYLDMMMHPVQMWQTITALSPFMENRSYDLLGGWIQDQLRQIDLPKAKRLLLQFQNIGMQGLEWIDRFTVAGGWYAIYQQELARMQEGNLQENMRKAAAIADEFVQETQPQSDITELSPMFKNRSEALTILTQFQSSLNVIWQNVTFDIPQAFKNHSYREALGMIAGYLIAGALVYLVQEGFDDDDDDKDKMRKVLYGMTTQITSGIPLVSNEVDNLVYRLTTGEKQMSWGTTIFPAFSKFMDAANKVIDGNYEKALQYVMDATALSFGLPYSGFKELQAAFTTDEGIKAFLGRREQ